MRYVLIALLLFPVAVLASGWGDVWTTNAPSRELVEVRCDEVYVGFEGMIRHEQQYAWECYLALTERVAAVRWIHNYSNLWWAAGLRELFDDRRHQYRALAELKRDVEGWLILYTDVEALRAIGIDEFLISGDPFPHLTGDSVIDQLGLPTNFFSYTPARGTTRHAEPVVDEFMEAGRDSRDYGWDRLRDVIEFMQAFEPSAHGPMDPLLTIESRGYGFPPSIDYTPDELDTPALVPHGVTTRTTGRLSGAGLGVRSVRPWFAKDNFRHVYGSPNEWSACGLFIATDAGPEWSRNVDNYSFFSWGNHGVESILAAVSNSQPMVRSGLVEMHVRRDRLLTVAGVTYTNEVAGSITLRDGAGVVPFLCEVATNEVVFVSGGLPLGAVTSEWTMVEFVTDRLIGDFLPLPLEATQLYSYDTTIINELTSAYQGWGGNLTERYWDHPGLWENYTAEKRVIMRPYFRFRQD